MKEFHSDNRLLKQKLFDSLIENGDTNIYEHLWSLNHGVLNESFLPIALVMANKFDYTSAYVDVFSCFNNIYSDYDENIKKSSLKKFDKKSKKLALEYLNVALQRNNIVAKHIQCEFDLNCNDDSSFIKLIHK